MRGDEDGFVAGPFELQSEIVNMLRDPAEMRKIVFRYQGDAHGFLSHYPTGRIKGGLK
jgi:hypothetical protein